MACARFIGHLVRNAESVTYTTSHNARRRACRAAGRHRLPPPGSDAGTVRVRLYAVAPAAIIGGLQLGPFTACTNRGYAMGTDHGEQDRRDENRPRTVGMPTGRPPTGGRSRCRPTAVFGRAIAVTRRASTWRRTARAVRRQLRCPVAAS